MLLGAGAGSGVCWVLGQVVMSLGAGAGSDVAGCWAGSRSDVSVDRHDSVTCTRDRGFYRHDRGGYRHDRVFSA